MDLRSWRFDQTNAVDAEHLGAISAKDISLVESWSGYAWDVTAPVAPLILPAVRETGRLNLAPGLGSVRLWFAPAWSSETLSGGGPGAWATLLELNQSNRTAFTLALAIDPTGNSLQVLVGTGKSWTPWLQAEIAWAAGQWHQVTLLYSAEGVALMVDADVVASTDQPLPWPEEKVWNRSVFSLGTALDGRQPARGWLDEIFTFAYAPHPDYVAMRYFQAAAVAAMGPVSEGEWPLRRTPSALRVSSGENTLYSSSLPGPPLCEGCPTNVPVAPPPVPGFSITNGLRFAPAPYLTNNGSGYVTWLLGTNTGERYEIYQTTNLVGTSVWVSTWSLLATGGVSFTFAHPSNDGARAFYLAATYVDADGDGLSDAYESLVLRTTNLWDFDSDGMPDFWEKAHGLSYTNRNDATNDFDGDGIKNLAEYQYEAALINPVEPLGPSSRRTPLVISEIMYHPATNGTEFIEIYNTHHLPQKLDGFTLVDPEEPTPHYTFTNTTLAPGAFTIAAFPSGSNWLPTSPKLQLRNNRGAVLLEVEYSDKAPWPKAADGTGHSLVLARPSYGENDVRAWSPSAKRGGSPGTSEPVIQDFKAAVRINEFLANPAGGNQEFIEVHNASSVTQDISGWHLACNAGALAAYTFPVGTLLPPCGFRHVLGNPTNAPNQLPFNLNNGGEPIFLTTADLTRVVDAVNFGPQESGISTGRSPEGGPVFRQLATPTAGGTNALPLGRNIVINEIMYNPISGGDTNEYVEIYNRGTNSQSLSNWSFDGITFVFPPSFVLAPTNYVVVAHRTNILFSLYPGRFTLGTNLVGDYQNTLANGGDRLALKNASGVIIDEVTFADGGRWGSWSDGGGSSLELIDPRADHRQPSNWADSDEFNKSQWVTNTAAGVVLSLGDLSPANVLELGLLDVGDCLIDDVSLKLSEGSEQVQNGNFSIGLSSWGAQGCYSASSLMTTGGIGNSACLRASGLGRVEYLANRITNLLASTIATNVWVTNSFKARWLRGNPELLVRLRGNGFENVATLPIPSNLGTPGLSNSRAMKNVGPAIYDVAHFPPVPAAGERVLVTARAQDPDGISSTVLSYRIDPATTFTNVTMHDDGTGGDAAAGDGLFSATIPGQSAGKVAAFYVEARDGAAASLTSRFPSGAPVRECLVRFGDPMPSGSFAVYRLWLTQTNISTWGSRSKIDSTPLNLTFVYGTNRVIYNCGGAFSGSDSTSMFYDNPTNILCGYSIDAPADDRFLGCSSIDLDISPRDFSGQREVLANWLADKNGLVSNHRRFVNLFANGRSGTQRPVGDVGWNGAVLVYSDIQVPGSDVLSEWYPGNDNGDLYKITWWIKTNAANGNLNNVLKQDASLLAVTNASGLKNGPSYRWNWRKRAAANANNDHTNFFNLVDAMNTNGANYIPAIANAINVEQWGRALGLEHTIVNSDSYGYGNGQNMFAYKRSGAAATRPWELLLYDLEEGFPISATSASNSVFDTFQDPVIAKLWGTNAFKRAYWRGFSSLVNESNGPMSPDQVHPVAALNHQALINNSLTVTGYTVLTNWIGQRYASLTNQLAAVRPPFSILTPTNGTSTSNSTMTISGLAAVEIKDITLNSNTVEITWSTVTNWSFSAPLNIGTNTLQVKGYDGNGLNLVSSNMSIIRTNPVRD